MSNYNSTHTGAELDEAIGRVIDGGSIKVQVDTNTTNITDLQGRMTTAEGAITDTAEHVADIEDGIEELLEVVVLKPSTFDTASTNVYPANLYRFPCDANFSNIAYRDKEITDIYVRCYNSGTLKIVVGSNIFVGSTNPSTSDAESFAVVAGVNQLHLTTPIKVTTATDFVGIYSTSSNKAEPYKASDGDNSMLYISSGAVSSNTDSLSVYFVCKNDLNAEIDKVRDELAEFAEDIAPLFYTDAQKPSSFETAPTATYPANLYRFPTNRDYTNEDYRNKTITDIIVNVYNSGTLQVVIGHGIVSGSTSATTELVESFAVTAGIKKLHLSTPVTITSPTDFIGIHSATANKAEVLKSSSGDTRMFYIGSGEVKTDTDSLSVYFIVREDVTERLDAVEEVVERYETSHLKSDTALVIGASFAYDANTWFEQACARLGLSAINKAISGTKIHDDAVRLMNGTLFDDINAFDILVMMHVHNYDVDALPSAYKDYTPADYEADTSFVDAMTNGTRTNAWYSSAFDYVIKKYESLCYAEKTNASSPWYGKKSGKPCVIVMCSSWHDARQTYNSSSKTLAEKWGMHYCDFASNIGFSCQKNNIATGAQPSLLYSMNGDAGVESLDITIDGVLVPNVQVGWHPLQGETQYIQQLMSQIASDAIKGAMW